MSADLPTELLDTDDPSLLEVKTSGQGPAGRLPLSDSLLRHGASGDHFGMSQDVGMGWPAEQVAGPQFVLLSTMGGLRGDDGRPWALGYHTGHWELGLAVREAAEEITLLGGVPYAAHCSDPCDGRTQGTVGMFDSLAYRNDAAAVFARLARSIPRARGVLGIATCDKGLPAMMMALAGAGELPVALVPGGVMLPPRRERAATAGTESPSASDGGVSPPTRSRDGLANTHPSLPREDTATIQSIGARYAQGEMSLDEAAEWGCRVCASGGGGCHFLGTAATAQVVAEALGLALPHSALAPSGQPIWFDIARRTARTLFVNATRTTQRRARGDRSPNGSPLTPASLRNAMAVFAAFGGSTNLLIHLPAIAYAAGLRRPTLDDWAQLMQRVPRLVSVLPNGPVNHPTIRVYLAGGVPEVMLHLRSLDLLDLDAPTLPGAPLGRVLDWWEHSQRRRRLRAWLEQADGVRPDDVILSPQRAGEMGLTATACFPRGNLAPGGSCVKSTAIDRRLLDANGIYRKTGPAKIFCREADAIAAIKGHGTKRVEPGDVLVLMGRGPMGSGMEEVFQLTAALRYLSWGREVALITDARFSGVSTGPCIGLVTPEALAGGPLGKLHDGDQVRIVIDTRGLTGSVDLVGTPQGPLSPEEAAAVLAGREPHPELSPDPHLPRETRLWAALQHAGGGPWGGCVYDIEEIVARLTAPPKPRD